jgi:hypothetical protein
VRAGRTLAACLFVFGLLALGVAGGVAAQQPSPEELWELYPLDPTEQGERERPATTTEAVAPSPPPAAGGGTDTTSSSRPDAAVDSSADDASLSLALVLGGLAAAIVLLATAALPAAAAPGVAGLLIRHRLELALAGAVALLVVTVVYLVTVA